MSRRVVITDEAERNILSNAVWWAENRSVEQARRWLVEARRTTEDLPRTAPSCPLSRENGRPEFKVELRDKLFGLGRGNTHRIVFTMTDKVIYVLTVRSTRQDDLQIVDLGEIEPGQ